MTPPPIQIHITSGSTITPITAGAPGLAAVEAKRQVDVLGRPLRTDGVPISSLAKG